MSARAGFDLLRSIHKMQLKQIIIIIFWQAQGSPQEQRMADWMKHLWGEEKTARENKESEK